MNFSHTLIGFPFRSILRNALRLGAPAGGALWIQEDRISAQFFPERRSFSTDELKATPGAPLLLAPLGRNTAFTAEVLQPNRLARDGRFAIVVDHPEAIVSLVQTKNLSVNSIAELRSLPMETLLPTPTLPDSFSWEILSPELKPLPTFGPLPPSVVVVGLPQKICWWVEKWVESVDGMLLCLCPSLLAILHWCRMRTPAFALLPRKSNSYLAVFLEEKLHLLTKLPGTEWLFGSFVEPLVEEIRRELQLPDSPLCIYPGGLSDTQVEVFLNRFKSPLRVFGPQANSNIGLPNAEQAVLTDAYLNAIL